LIQFKTGEFFEFEEAMVSLLPRGRENESNVETLWTIYDEHDTHPIKNCR
jgi:hypothetical protein